MKRGKFTDAQVRIQFNIVTLPGKSGEIAETLKRRCIDIFVNVFRLEGKEKVLSWLEMGVCCYGVVVVKSVLQIRVSQVAGNCKGEFEAAESYRKHI